MYGVPYVGWSPRPAKNGQPTTCTSCIPARKVGGLARRIPQIWAGPKTKEQILEKWDPVSKRLVKVKCECVTVSEEPPIPTPTIEGYQFIVTSFSDLGNVGGSITFDYNSGNLPTRLIFTYNDNTGLVIPEPPRGNIYVYTRTGTLLTVYPNVSTTSLTVSFNNFFWALNANTVESEPNWTIGDIVVLRYTAI
jgi:hypothetical protein